VGTINRIAESLTVLLIFVIVLLATYLATRFVAGYQKAQMTQGNIKILETARISQTKYLQLLQVGEVYMVIAVCKDSVTMLTTIEKEKLDLDLIQKAPEGKPDFKEILSQFMDQTPFGGKDKKGKKGKPDQKS